VLRERGGQQARQNLLHAGPQLDVEELPPGAGLREAARPARVHHTLWKTGQDLVQVICSEEHQRSMMLRCTSTSMSAIFHLLVF